MDAGVGETMAISALIGAGVGGAGAALQGGDPLKGALIGGVGGAVPGGAMGAFGGGAAAATEASGMIGTEIGSMTAAGATQAEISQALQATYGMTAEQAQAAMLQQASTGITNAGINMANAQAAGLPGQVGSNALQNTTVANAAGNVNAPITSGYNIPSYEPGGSAGLPGSGLDYQGLTTTSAANQIGPGTVQPPGTLGEGFMKGLKEYQTPAIAGALGIGALSLMDQDKKKFGVPATEHYDGPLNYFKYNPSTYKPTYPTQPNPAYTAQYPNYRATPYAEGGIAQLAEGGDTGSHIYKPQYVDYRQQAATSATPMQPQGQGFVNPSIPVPTSRTAMPNTSSFNPMLIPHNPMWQAEQNRLAAIEAAKQAEMASASSPFGGDGGAKAGGLMPRDLKYASGGIAGLLKGRGDGMSDSIHATIADKQPARLADGEFVVPADVVSHLGNGSTDAGAKHLYKMMDKVRHARTGNKKQGKQIAAGGYLPA